MASGRRKPRRRLTEDERALWDRFSATLTPIEKRRRDTGAGTGVPEPRNRPSPPEATTPPRAEPPPLPPPQIPRPQQTPAKGRVRVSLSPDPMDRLRTAPPRMDAKTFGRLKRGKLAPEARIDLHGMSAQRAHAALRMFLADAYAREMRLVLVITGKGRRDHPMDPPARQGVLRNELPHWLAQPPLSALVLQTSPAHDRHGGGGAYYVYLRRRR
ncbi:DNA mismatch repair protein MutS [Rhodobacteraceae bacterium 2CG4]|uniref:DNA mismatch repair protein MutS n=2 Tax=Halovulum marinum TaxID=2662447 RepID=A0A6L5Z290_9RHOB|nr:DNA mismatch repair protein MutS [Halovulum marinum]